MADAAATIQIMTVTITEATTVTVMESHTVTMLAPFIASMSSGDVPLLQFSSFAASLSGIVVAIVAILAGWTIWDWHNKAETIIVDKAAKKAADMVVDKVTEKVLKIILPRLGEPAKEKSQETTKETLK